MKEILTQKNKRKEPEETEQRETDGGRGWRINGRQIFILFNLKDNEKLKT